MAKFNTRAVNAQVTACGHQVHAYVPEPGAIWIFIDLDDGY